MRSDIELFDTGWWLPERTLLAWGWTTDGYFVSPYAALRFPRCLCLSKHAKPTPAREFQTFLIWRGRVYRRGAKIIGPHRLPQFCWYHRQRPTVRGRRNLTATSDKP